MTLTREFYMPEGYIYTDYGFAVIGIGESKKGLCAIGFSGKRAKPDFHYSFSPRFGHPTEQREKHIKDYIENLKQREEESKKRKEARHNFTNHFKVGDILYDSWGYEQTNIDFFQVVEVKPKSVVIREIASRVIEGGGMAMSGQVVAVPDSFVGEPTPKKLTGYLNSEGETVAHVTSRHGWISEWDGKPKYYSSYA